MKKGLKIAGAIAGLAALAALTPYSVCRDEEDKTTVCALLWKYTNQPDPEGGRKVSIDIGFHNPFCENNDHLLIDDDEGVILMDAPEEPSCDIELTLEPKLDEEPAQCEKTPAEVQPEV